MSRIANTIIEEILKSDRKMFRKHDIIELIDKIQTDHRIICAGNLVLNSNGNLVQIGNNLPFRIANIDFNLLVYLVDREGELVKKESILRDVWNDVVVGEKIVDVAIHRLRSIIGKDRIVTHRKIGYKYES
jgi:DNA-binding response OmpR family regulator